MREASSGLTTFLVSIHEIEGNLVKDLQMPQPAQNSKVYLERRRRTPPGGEPFPARAGQLQEADRSLSLQKGEIPNRVEAHKIKERRRHISGGPAWANSVRGSLAPEKPEMQEPRIFGPGE